MAALYLEIDAKFETDLAAIADGPSMDRVREKQILNDQAWFILGWGQLETAINEACREAIRARRDNADRAVRRAWEIFNPDDRRLSGLVFEERAALVLDKRRGPDCAWNKAMSHYNTRNRIAHGSLLLNRLDMPNVFDEFFAIQSELEK